MNEKHLRGLCGKSVSVQAHGRPFLVVCFAILLAGSSVGRASETMIELGGPRKATAKLRSADTGKICEISFVGVRAFDQPTNELLNQSKSKFYAIQAFAKYHKIPSGARFSCAVRRIAPLKSEGDRVTSSYQLDSISLSEEEPAPSREEGPNRSSPRSTADQVPDDLHPGHRGTGSDLLTPKSEMTSTLMVLVTSLQERIDAIRSEDDTEALAQEVAELESSIQEKVQSFDAAVNGERLLLDSEKDQLKASSHKQSKQLMGALAARYQALIKAEPNKSTPNP